MVRSIQPTFKKLNDIIKNPDDKTFSLKMAKEDRPILQRLVIGYDAGRKVNLDVTLRHELLPSPPSIAEMNGLPAGGLTKHIDI